MFRALKPYERYGTAPGQWIPAMPDHWRVAPGSRVLKPVAVKNAGLVESTVLSLSYGRVIVKPPEKLRGLVPESFETYQILEPGDIVVRPTDLQNDKTSLRVGHVHDRGIITSAYIGLRPNGISDTYAFTYLAALDHMKIFYGMGSGLRQNLDIKDFKRLPVPIPPANEQAAIVKYLGHALARIDRAIASKRKLIALLEEQKQTIIQQAVTRGLDHSVPLADSGIPWLGQIPAHWELLSVRRHWSITDCKHLTVPFTDTGIPLASVRQAQRFELSLSDARHTSREHYDTLIQGGRKPRAGDLIYCRNVGVGMAAIVGEVEDFAMGQDVALLRSSDQDSRFFNYFLRSRSMNSQLEGVLVGSTFRRINVEQIKGLLVVTPPIAEQSEIAQYLDLELAGLSSLGTSIAREIELLREFRTRVTSDVVTGQVDVREIAATLPELTDEVRVSAIDEFDDDELIEAELEFVGVDK